MSTAPASPSADPLGLFRLDGKVCIVTGASSGLGARFARVLASAGAKVVVAARRADRLDALVAELGDQAFAVAVDVTAADGPQNLIDATVAQFDRMDVLVNNAGKSNVAPALDYSQAEFRDEVELNLIAPYELSRLAATHMVEAGSGVVINIGSILGHGGGGKLRAPGYAASKGGIHNLTRELASQWAGKGVRVNALAPAWFRTEMNDDMFDTSGGMSYITDNTPMRRPGEEGELDGALLFLASDASTYVTGHILNVDGGWSCI